MRYRLLLLRTDRDSLPLELWETSARSVEAPTPRDAALRAVQRCCKLLQYAALVPVAELPRELIAYVAVGRTHQNGMPIVVEKFDIQVSPSDTGVAAC